tara:strand:- start:441 stop:689 length:249 start_codon:yes stop_codon:yes gene_type:complete
MNDLPEDIIIFTSYYFNIKELLRFSITNKLHKQIIENSSQNEFIIMERNEWFWRRGPPPHAMRLSWKRKRNRNDETALLLFS